MIHGTRVSQVVLGTPLVSTSPTYYAAQLLSTTALTIAATYRIAQVSGSSVVYNTTLTSRIGQNNATSIYDNIAATFRTSCLSASGVLSSSSTQVHITQCSIAFICAYKGLPMPAIYPELHVGFSLIKRPIGSWASAQATSGAEIRVNYWSTPIWEWDLTYEYLPDTNTRNGITPSDLKTLMGFYASTQCGYAPFFFNDTDDNQVIGQPVGTGDGNTLTFSLSRTFGLGQYTVTEPVGSVNVSGPPLNGNGPFNVYLNGILQTPTSYTVVTSTPMNNFIRFFQAPPVGAVITCDMSYYYYVRFADPKYDFEKFMDKLWSTKKITLRSLRS